MLQTKGLCCCLLVFSRTFAQQTGSLQTIFNCFFIKNKNYDHNGISY